MWAQLYVKIKALSLQLSYHWALITPGVSIKRIKLITSDIRWRSMLDPHIHSTKVLASEH